MKKTIGIIGGMGPLATADLFSKIIRYTDADSDQAHLRVIIDSNTNIPDRTAAILHGGPSPLPALIESAKLLEAAGADLLIMPCNTAHYFHAELAESTRLPVLNMLEHTADALIASGCRRAGLLATDGTLATNLYTDLFKSRGIETVTPTPAGQALLMSLIYDDIKGGRMRTDAALLRAMLADMQRRGAETFVLACTELPIAFSRDDLGVPYLDPTAVLAKAAVLAAGGMLKAE